MHFAALLCSWRFLYFTFTLWHYWTKEKKNIFVLCFYCLLCFESFLPKCQQQLLIQKLLIFMWCLGFLTFFFVCCLASSQLCAAFYAASFSVAFPIALFSLQSLEIALAGTFFTINDTCYIYKYKHTHMYIYMNIIIYNWDLILHLQLKYWICIIFAAHAETWIIFAFCLTIFHCAHLLAHTSTRTHRHTHSRTRDATYAHTHRHTHKFRFAPMYYACGATGRAESSGTACVCISFAFSRCALMLSSRSQTFDYPTPLSCHEQLNRHNERPAVWKSPQSRWKLWKSSTA